MVILWLMIVNSDILWLVVDLPLWKMMDFVSWDDCSIPNGSGKIYRKITKVMFQTTKEFSMQKKSRNAGNRRYSTWRHPDQRKKEPAIKGARGQLLPEFHERPMYPLKTLTWCWHMDNSIQFHTQISSNIHLRAYDSIETMEIPCGLSWRRELWCCLCCGSPLWGIVICLAAKSSWEIYGDLWRSMETASNLGHPNMG